MLQYTGGTTGTPKGAMLTHANIWANVVQTESWTNPSYILGGNERYLVVIPYFHIYAFSVCMMVGLRVGALQIIHPKYEPEAVLASIRDLRPTYFPAVPTVFVSLLNHPKIADYGLERVRLFNSGGAPCPVEVLEEFERRIGRPLGEGYGLSETSPVTHSTPQLALRKMGTIGLPFPDTDTKIVDVETGERELPFGEIGELCVSGPQVMKGYWNKPEESAHVLRRHADGRIWFHTGDVARIDQDGYTSIVQRKKDMIIVDGYNVYPSDVESVLYAHPAVRLAAVIGIPDPYHGEVVKACIALKPGASATRRRDHRLLPRGAHRVQGAARGRDPRHPADERGRQDSLSRAARRTRRLGEGMTHVEARRTMSGLEFFQKMLSGEMPPPPMIDLLGIRLAEVEAGRVVFTATCEERFYNGTGVAHGGFAATILDTALGCAINSAMPAGRRFTTLELKVNLTRPITKDAGLLRCEAKVVHVGGRTATSEGRIVDRNGKLYAHGTTTCIIVDAPRGPLEP